MLGRKKYSNLASSVLSVLSGSVIASALNIIALPFVAQLYDPETVGVGIVFLSLHSFLLVLATGRYSVGIPLPKKNETARYLFWIVVVLSFIFGLLVGLVGSFLAAKISLIFDAPELQFWVPFLGLTVFAAAMSEAVHYLLIRKKCFKTTAVIGVAQATLTIGGVLLFALLHHPTVKSYMTAQVIGIVLTSLLSVMISAQSQKRSLSFRRLFKVAAIYRRLPQHLFTTSLLNTGSVIALPLVISAFSGPSVAAAYAMAAQLVSRPLAMISSAIWRVVYGELGGLSSDTRRVRHLLKRVFFTTSLLYGAVVIVVVAFSNSIVFLFGEKWEQAGPMMQAVIVMAYFQHVSNSVSYFQSFGRYAAESFANATLVAFRVSVLVSSSIIGVNGQLTVVLFCLVSAMLYFFIITYWSRVLGFGWQFTFGAGCIFFAAYAIGLIAIELFSEPLARMMFIASVITCVFYAQRRISLNVRSHD